LDDIRNIASSLDDTIKKGMEVAKDKVEKALTFNPLKPHEMTSDSMYYNPYRILSDGSYAPHPTGYWTSLGRDPEGYKETDKFYRMAGERLGSWEGLGKSLKRIESISRSIHGLINVEKAEEELPEKIKTDAFVYLEPKEKEHQNSFAQCKSCPMWTGALHNTCTIHDTNVKVTGDMTCTLYVHGEPMPEQAGHEMGSVTPEESGLTKAQVRCENCKYFDDKSVCLLFRKLNKTMPQVFDLKETVQAKGCCNGWMSK